MVYLEFVLFELLRWEFKVIYDNKERFWLWRKGRGRRGFGRNLKGFNIVILWVC